MPCALDFYILHFLIYRETDIRVLGLGAIHTLRRNYPPDKGAHIAISKYSENHTISFPNSVGKLG